MDPNGWVCFRRWEIGARIGLDERKPGAQDVFGQVVFCQHLVERIGLDADDNRNLTRRALLLLESRPIATTPYTTLVGSGCSMATSTNRSRTSDRHGSYSTT